MSYTFALTAKISMKKRTKENGNPLKPTSKHTTTWSAPTVFALNAW